MPRKSSFPIWIDESDELTLSVSKEHDGILYLDINGESVFAMDRDDALDIAEALTKWARERE